MSLTSIQWKIATAFGVSAALILGFLLLTARMDIRSLNKTVENRDKQISVLKEDLAQARTNVATLEGAIVDQRARLEARAAADARQLADTTTRLGVAQRDAATARATAGRLAAPAVGSTLEDRVRDVDARILETLK